MTTLQVHQLLLRSASFFFFLTCGLSALVVQAQKPVEVAPVQKQAAKAAAFTFFYPMKRITGGTFIMGSPLDDGNRLKEECPHTVTVATFSMGQTEVTQAQWKAVMGTNPSHFKGDQLPVEQVSWNDAQAFIKKLNQLLPAGQKPYRLPTEAEWEYAAVGGAGKHTTFAGTNDESELYRYANFCDSLCNEPGAQSSQTDGFAYTAPVGSLHPNALGLYDMTGNVSEWCQDVYGPYPGCSEPPLSGGQVLRGGAWDDGIFLSRVAGRVSLGADLVMDFMYSGFRLAQD